MIVEDNLNPASYCNVLLKNKVNFDLLSILY